MDQRIRDAPHTQPKDAAGWHLLANELLEQGSVDRAISAYRRALRIDDTLAEAHNDLGTAYYQKGWMAEAEACFRKAIEHDPRHAVAHGNLGAALRAQGRLSDSRRAYQRALVLKLLRFWPFNSRPKNRIAKPERDEAEALHQAAGEHERKRDYEAALRSVRRALELKGERTEYHVTLARVLVRTGDHDGALRAGMAALKLEPGSPQVHATMAGIFHSWRDDLAEQAARHALEIDPATDLAHANLGAALWGQGRLEEAARAAREAVRLNPNDIAYRTNLAVILKDLDRISEARELYQQLLADAPSHAKVCLDLGTLALETEGDLATARRLYRKAQAIGDEPRAQMGEALVDFLEGRYGDAWPNYEARKRIPDQRVHHQQFDALAEWDGSPAKPGTLVVYGEQGLGDEIMFASLFPDLAKRAPGSRVMSDPRLAALFGRSFPALEVIGAARGTPPPTGAKFKIAAGSLGRFFRRHAQDFPRHTGYLVPDPAKVAAWRERLQSHKGTRKIGLSWLGGVQKTGRSRRSVALEALRPVLATPGVSWISLQYTDAGAEIAALAREHGIELADYRHATRDMDELASLVQALDLVVSVCNTTVHVAGAIGKPALVLAPFVPEWRYGMREERMIWYPSVRVLRQTRYGDWSDVIKNCSEQISRKNGSEQIS